MPHSLRHPRARHQNTGTDNDVPSPFSGRTIYLITHIISLRLFFQPLSTAPATASCPLTTMSFPPSTPSPTGAGPDRTCTTQDAHFRAVTTLLSILRPWPRPIGASRPLKPDTRRIAHCPTHRLDALCELLARTPDEAVALGVRHQRFPRAVRPIVYLFVSGPPRQPEGGITIERIPTPPLPPPADAGLPQTPDLPAHAQEPFENHAAVILHWLRRTATTTATSTSSSTRHGERFGGLASYIVFRLSPKLLARLRAGRDEFVHPLRAIEDLWARGALAPARCACGEASFGADARRPLWVRLWEEGASGDSGGEGCSGGGSNGAGKDGGSDDSSEYGGMYNPRTSRGFNRFLLRLLASLEADLASLQPYALGTAAATATASGVGNAMVQARRGAHRAVCAVHSLLNGNGVLAVHLRFVADELALGDGWADAYVTWLTLLTRPLECVHGLQGPGSGSGGLRRVLHACDVAVVRCQPAPGIAPWQPIVRELIAGERGQRLAAYLQSRADGDASLPGGMRQLCRCQWQFGGSLHPLALVAGLRSAARETVAHFPPGSGALGDGGGGRMPMGPIAAEEFAHLDPLVGSSAQPPCAVCSSLLGRSMATSATQTGFPGIADPNALVMPCALPPLASAPVVRRVVRRFEAELVSVLEGVLRTIEVGVPPSPPAVDGDGDREEEGEAGRGD